MAESATIAFLDSYEDIEIIEQGTKGSDSRQSSIMIVGGGGSRSLIDCIELPKWSAERKKGFERGRFLGHFPGSSDLVPNRLSSGPSGEEELKKPRWRTIADSSDEEETFQSRDRHADSDYESIESEDSAEPDVVDVDLESEGNEWDKRPQRPAKRIRKSASRYSTATIESDSDVPSRHRKRGRRAAPDLDNDDDNFDEVMDDSEDDLANADLVRRHRPNCTKCHQKPAHDKFKAMLKRQSTKGKSKKRRVDEFLEDEEVSIDKLGGWTECKSCCASLHWGCLPANFRHELLATDKLLDPDKRQMPSGRLRMDKKLMIECPFCVNEVTKDCYVCWNGPDTASGSDERKTDLTSGLLFRCVRCYRAAHYHHLPTLDETKPSPSVLDLAREYQSGRPRESWLCRDCIRLPQDVEHIIAWRYSPQEAKDDRVSNKVPLIAQNIRREYLLKFKGWGFRHATWVLHSYIVQTGAPKLRHFLEHGSRLQIKTETDLANNGDELMDEEEVALQVDDEAKQLDDQDANEGRPQSRPDAYAELPKSWSTPDRILDVWFLTKVTFIKPKQNRVESPEPEPEGVNYDFSKPDKSQLVHIDEWERRNRLHLKPEDAETYISRIGWAYVKWQDLQYEDATEDTPIAPDSPLYPAYLAAFRTYLYARTVQIPILTKAEALRRDARPVHGYQRLMGQQPECVQNGTLMGFQVDGLDWLMNKWYNLTSVILADDMGLGKTVQIAAFLGLLGSKAWSTFPALVVVPNSTLQNWMREFAKWVPHLRVVPLQGSKASRDIIRKYELFSSKGELKCHVVLVTYEIITSQKDYSILLSKVPRWECLIVDEGARLKNQSNMITKKLTALKPVHKILLTGTPLNNTVRELLNLMYFLDPEEWSNLDELERHYEDMTESLARELRDKIAPYMLRRRKEDVLDLPSKSEKNEVIVPLTMRPLQRNVYKSILEKNADLMQALAQATTKGGPPLKMKACHNILMQLRKCLQHPFLNTPQLEDRNLGRNEAHQALIDASAKLTFLKILLPKLKAKGHRILLFSQFVMALNIIEDFCDGEGYPTLRLDGNTPQDQRQRDIDAFNAPDSTHFLFLISTRAGGMGINLATADTVIVHDLDFNPHQDMQAIARAYRYGQKKKVLVMRLMTTPTVEERMMQVAKKKLVLDHLIVQTKNSEDTGNVASILLDGARAIIDGTDTQDATYNDQAVDDLILKLETGEEAKTKDASGFTFAPVFDNKKGKLRALDTETAAPAEDPDFWADVVKRAREERIQREMEEHGRGKRKRAKQNQTVDVLGNEDPVTEKKARKGKNKDTREGSDGSIYEFKDMGVDSDNEIDSAEVAREVQGQLASGPSIPRKNLLSEPAQLARLAHDRRLSAEGEECLKSGNPYAIGSFHLRQVHSLASMFGLYSKDKLAEVMCSITDPNKTTDQRMAEYLKIARVIDNHFEYQGQMRICSVRESLKEVQTILTSPPTKPVNAPPNGVASSASRPVQVRPKQPRQAAPLAAKAVEVCPSCKAPVTQPRTCISCIAGIQTQIRAVTESTEDTEADKNLVLKALQSLLAQKRASAPKAQA